jgi:hypothetical protein
MSVCVSYLQVVTHIFFFYRISKCYVAEEQFFVFCVPSHGNAEDEGVIAFQSAEARSILDEINKHVADYNERQQSTEWDLTTDNITDSTISPRASPKSPPSLLEGSHLHHHRRHSSLSEICFETYTDGENEKWSNSIADDDELGTSAPLSPIEANNSNANSNNANSNNANSKRPTSTGLRNSGPLLISLTPSTSTLTTTCTTTTTTTTPASANASELDSTEHDE